MAIAVWYATLKHASQTRSNVHAGVVAGVAVFDCLLV
jgi:hypothetical protein